jgi:hypothetical protein
MPCFIVKKHHGLIAALKPSKYLTEEVRHAKEIDLYHRIVAIDERNVVAEMTLKNATEAQPLEGQDRSKLIEQLQDQRGT